MGVEIVMDICLPINFNNFSLLFFTSVCTLFKFVQFFEYEVTLLIIKHLKQYTALVPLSVLQIDIEHLVVNDPFNVAMCVFGYFLDHK